MEINKIYCMDAFMGSGTTAICCKNLNRRYIGFENNPEYIKICESRLSQESLNKYTETGKLI